jgi:hypothetical protein
MVKNIHYLLIAGRRPVIYHSRSRRLRLAPCVDLDYGEKENTAFESVVFSEISDLKKVKTTKWIDINNKKTFYKQNGGLKTIFLKINNFELEQK